jgi:addiction module RelE/StbE family toxin
LSHRPFRVDWAEVARRDLFAIVDYLIDRHPDAAASILDKLERRAAFLRKSPERGRVIPELERLQLREYRELVVSPYRLVYRVSGRRVLVLGVLDSRRNLEDLLLDRLVFRFS